MAMSVYCGTTSSEIEAIRAILIEQVRQAGMTPVTLDEREMADDSSLAGRIRAKITAADRYLGLVTYKRGWEPSSLNGKTISEVEFEAARELGKDPVILLPQPDSEIGQQLRQSAMAQDRIYRQAQKQAMGRMKQDTSFIYFANEADLSAQVAQLLSSWAMPEMIRAMQTPSPRMQNWWSRALDLERIVEQIASMTAMKLNLLNQKDQAELAEQTLKYQEALRLKPGELVFGKPLTSSQFQSDVFVIMPFASDYDPVYQGVIRPLINNLDLRCVRGDEFTSSRGSVMEEVWAAINGCRFVIADISGSNNNVFYELGIAHTLNKSAILITQAERPEDVPFDIRHLRYIQYRIDEAGQKRLRDDLESAVSWLLADLEEGWGENAGS